MKKRQTSEDFIRKISAKLHIKIAHDTVQMLRLLRDTRLTQREYAQYLGWSRYKVFYQVTKLRKANLISRIKHTQFFKANVSGVNVLDQYESTEKKYEIGIENARWKVLIANPRQLQKFLFDNYFSYHAMNNWIQWNGEIDGFKIQVNTSEVKTTMVIQHPTMYGGSFMSQTNDAERRINVIFSNIDKKYNFKMGVPELLPTGQFTMNNPIAKHLMEKTGGSQIKIDGRISFDQSFGSEPRTELSNLSDAILWDAMPKTFVEIVGAVRNLNEDMQILKPSIIGIAKSLKYMEKSLERIEKGSEQMVSKVEVPKDLNQDTSRMYG